MAPLALLLWAHACLPSGPPAPSQAAGAGAAGAASAEDPTGAGGGGHLWIEGIVFGLEGANTVALANGGESLQVANGIFRFADAQTEGSDYNVVVAAQPPDQACTVAAGSGVVGEGAVSSIVVSCAPSGGFRLGGTVSGLPAQTAVTLRTGPVAFSVGQNGTFTLPSPFSAGTPYALSVWAPPQGAACTISGGEGVIADRDVTSVEIVCAPAPQPAWTFSSGQSAAVAIGQPNLTSLLSNPLRSAQVLYNYWAFGRTGLKAYAVPGGPLYVPDFWNFRVLVFDAVPAADFQAATQVIGAPDFTSPGSGDIYPYNVSGAPGALLVTNQQSYDSVFCYPTGFPAVDSNQFIILGRIDFGCEQAGGAMYPEARLLDGNLLVMDQGHNRIITWTPLPPLGTNGRPNPGGVIGQPDFTTCTAGHGSANFQNAGGFWADDSHLIVADTGNKRLLIWNQSPFSLTVGQPADHVLGAASTASVGDGSPSATTFVPATVDSDGTALVVTDTANNRVLFWHHIPTADNVPWDVVLGQPDPTQNFCNQSATPGTRPRADTLCQPSGASLSGPFIIVNDPGNLRVVIYRSEAG